MHITQLRIAGFKSFVDPTDVPIEPGLTGIVGPNGCGKSNLLESLRWAMGANSARAMRGGEMDDLIFSGAADRPARETAEVTLVLDNSARTAPPEFNASDVLEVTRRLKRSAGSTYKLNGRTVRGKDIQLLFADASTGANSPALVRQGQISELIASKPQNRRRILEEAAGIAGLNTRRHEAELKLRAAETNLERLTEVSAEVERQLESLKRQARKARKYTALSEEIAALEAYAAHLKWTVAEADVAAARQALETANADVERLTLEDAVAERNRINADAALAPLREAESVASAKLGQARIALARAEAEHKSAEEAEARLEAELARLGEDVAREQAMADEAAAAVARTQEELAALPVDDPAAGEEQEAAARAEAAAAREALTHKEAAADEASSRLSDARAKRAAAAATLQAQRNRKRQLEAEADRLRGQLTDAPDAVTLSATVAEAKAAEDGAEIALHDAQRAFDALESELAEARTAEAEAEAPKAAAEAEVRALEGEIAGLKRLLRRADGPKTPAVIERMRVRDGYEKAVAAALGDDLQAPTDRAAATYWAGAAAHGQGLPAGAAPLADFVEAPGELAPRLAQCGVVAPADGAALAAALGPGQRLVTLDGHLWRWDGFTRTPDAPTPAAERLAQQARLEGAEAELAPAKARLEAARVDMDAAAQARAAAAAAVKAARNDAPEAARALDTARKTLANATQAASAASVKRDAAQDALSRVEADLRHVADALALIADPGAGEDEAALEAAVADARSAVAAARADETEARGRLTDLTRGREQAQKRRASLERDLETWTKRAADSERRRDGLLTRRDETRASLAAAKGRPASEAGEFDRIAAHVEALDRERASAADRLAEAETGHRETETAARAASAAAGRAREALAAANVKLETASARLDELTEGAIAVFQRRPEGLLALARVGLDEEALGTLDVKEADRRADLLKRDRDALGGVNMEAEAEAEALAERLGAQAGEKADLTGAIAKLREGVGALNDEGRARLLEAFDTVNAHFQALFTALFRGGQAELRLIDADDPLAAGLEIFAQPPGKRLGTLSLMSGGEQALTAAALIFAVFLSNPAPICVLDEVDAPLDDANVDRFCRMLNEMRGRTNTRFVVITHNPVTMSRMDRLFGVTMREKGVSKLVSVDLHAAEQMVAAE